MHKAMLFLDIWSLSPGTKATQAQHLHTSSSLNSQVRTECLDLLLHLDLLPNKILGCVIVKACWGCGRIHNPGECWHAICKFKQRFQNDRLTKIVQLIL